jgi:hypothetical protein
LRIFISTLHLRLFSCMVWYFQGVGNQDTKVLVLAATNTPYSLDQVRFIYSLLFAVSQSFNALILCESGSIEQRLLSAAVLWEVLCILPDGILCCGIYALNLVSSICAHSI